eukprot:COSAG03_NODE_2472_length_2723_cov_3.062881_2_plen_256_part_00
MRARARALSAGNGGADSGWGQRAGGDHGISIVNNGATAWEALAPCGNREGCVPVSLFDDSTWHAVTVNIVPDPATHGAHVTFDLDNGVYRGSTTLSSYLLPAAPHLTFTGRTGASVDNHWIMAVSVGTGVHSLLPSLPADNDLPLPIPVSFGDMIISRRPQGHVFVDEHGCLPCPTSLCILPHISQAFDSEPHAPTQVLGAHDNWRGGWSERGGLPAAERYQRRLVQRTVRNVHWRWNWCVLRWIRLFVLPSNIQ